MADRRAVFALFCVVVACPGSTDAVARQTEDMRFTGAVEFRPVDPGDDGLFDALVAEVEVEVVTPGRYALNGHLKGDGRIIANRPSHWSAGFSHAVLERETGTYPVALSFSGEDIYRSGVDGPYELVVYAPGADPKTTLTVATPRYDHAAFGEVGATLVAASDSAMDLGGGPRLDVIRVTVDVSVRLPGTYELSGTLSARDESIVHARDTLSLTPGSRSVSLLFPGLPLLRSAIDGPYHAGLSLSDRARGSLGSLVFETSTYSARSFEPLLELTGSAVGKGIDSNDNGLLDILRVQLEGRVTRPGPYVIDGALRKPGAGRTVYTGHRVRLETTAQPIVLDFAGSEIRALDLDGPYELEVTLRDPETWEELDGVGAGSVSGGIDRAADFEPFGWSPIMLTGRSTDRGVDTDADGRFDRLHVEVEVELATADLYGWRARLIDANDTVIDTDSSEATLDVGIASLPFAFDGERINDHGVDGPYRVRSLLIFGRTGPSTVVYEVAETGQYQAVDFDSPEP